MMDIVDKATRSRMMSNIAGRNTAPELLLRKALHRKGFRFRLHVKGLPGKPDIVLAKYRAVIFTNGCFWHRHQGCRLASTPATRPEFWSAKFRANVERDAKVRDALIHSQWRVAVVWECALRKPPDVVAAAGIVAEWLTSDLATLELGFDDLHSQRAT